MYIIFDFDGTIADTFELGSKLINQYADKLGYRQIDFDANKDKSARQLIKMSGVKFWQIPGLIKFFRRQSVARAEEVKAFDKIPETIKQLHDEGKKIGIITTNSAETVAKFLEKYKLTEYISYIKTEISLFGKKRALRRAKRQLKTKITYIGDEIRDIEACQAVGIPIISVAWGFNSAEILETHNPNRVAHNAHQMADAARSIT